MHLSPDGKRIMMVGGGGWRPKDEGTGGGYITAIFSTANLEARVGEIPAKLNTIFHPVLDLGVINDYGVELIPFRRRSLVTQPAIMIKEDRAAERRVSLLTFGGQGSKIILWNGENVLKQQGLHFIPLDVTSEQRAQLVKAYGATSASTTSAAKPRLRKWTDRTGRFSVRAQFQGFSTEDAKLKKADGNIVVIPLSRLSKKDLDFLNSNR